MSFHSPSPELSEEALSVIEKVKKLLALAGNNDNEQEAAAASAKAMELLAAYNLDMASIKNGHGSNRKDTKLKGGLYNWQRELWNAIAKLNFCMYWAEKGMRKGETYQHRILGRHENVISSQVMADYLQQTIERLAREWAEYEGYNSIFVKEAIAYREGMAERLVERLNRLRDERLREDRKKQEEAKARASHPSYAARGTEIVLASVIQTEEDLNNDHLFGYEPGTTASNRAAREARAYAAQQAADAELRARDEAELANPALKAARLAHEAQKRAESDAWWAAYMKKHKSRGSGSYRERQETPREMRRNLRSFGQGYDKGADIGLDRQVDKTERKRI